MLDSISPVLQEFDQLKVKQASLYGLGKYLYRPSVPFQQRVDAVASNLLSLPEAELHQQGSNLVQKFFFEVVPLSSNREEILKQLGSKKGHAVQSLLSKELGALRETKKTEIDTDEKRMERKKAKANLAVKMGVVAKRAWTGNSGSVVLTDVKGKKLGLFKPSEENISTLRFIKILVLKHLFRVQSYWLTNGPLAGVRAEVAAYLSAKQNGYTFVPVTSLFEVEGVKGSFQLWAKGKEGEKVAEFGNIADAFDARTDYTEEEIELFQEFIGYDISIGNLDRHIWNWMVRYVDGAKLTGLVIIDHDRSFIKRNPSSIAGRRNQYLWGTLNIAKIPFRQKTLDQFKERYAPEKVDAWINLLKSHPDTSGLMSEEVEARARERAEVLYKVGTSPLESNFTPAELRNYRTDQSIHDFIYEDIRVNTPWFNLYN